jgi:hypothetical protein
MIGLLTLVSCKKQKNPEVKVQEIVVENVTSTDKEYMFTNYGGDYKWFETYVTLKDYLDNENCDGTVEKVSNVFQVVKGDEECFDVFVVLTAHEKEGSTYEIKDGFWVEDFSLNNEEIKLTFKEAFDKMMQANCPKPRSRQCVLRKQVGPVDCNPQYIFGNTKSQVYVDAITGDVSDKNPAFPEN